MSFQCGETIERDGQRWNAPVIVVAAFALDAAALADEGDGGGGGGGDGGSGDADGAEVGGGRLAVRPRRRRLRALLEQTARHGVDDVVDVGRSRRHSSVA